MRILGGILLVLAGALALLFLARVALRVYFFSALAAGRAPALSRVFSKTFTEVVEMRRSLGTRALTQTDSRVVSGTRRMMPLTLVFLALAVAAASVCMAAGLRLLLAF
jgi:hypothetical protein